METNRLVATKPYSVKHHLHINNWVDEVKTDLRLLPESKWFWKTARVAECWTQVTRWTTRWLRWLWLQLSLQLFTQQCHLNLQILSCIDCWQNIWFRAPCPMFLWQSVSVDQCDHGCSFRRQRCHPIHQFTESCIDFLDKASAFGSLSLSAQYSNISNIRISRTYHGQWSTLLSNPNSHGKASSCIDRQCKGSPPEMEKAADAADMSVLFFSAGDF